MTSIQDVADQINAKLDQLITNTAQTATTTGQIRDQIADLNNLVTGLNAHLRAGFADLADGLFAIWEVEKASLVELNHHSDQNDTIICLLQNANDLLCGITRKLTTEIDISREIGSAVRRVEGIAERVEPAAAGDYDRLRGISDRLTACCPPEPGEPEPCPDQCPERSHQRYQPRGQDWTPHRPPTPPR
jgi:hypothetical protein